MITTILNVSAIVQRYRSELFSLYPVREIEQFITLAFEEVMHYTKMEIFAHGESIVSPVNAALFETILEGLKLQEPIQYLLGKTVFYNLPIVVNEHVLIPRPETEELVHWVLSDEIKEHPYVIDLGTGSGCIAIALKANMQKAELFAIDDSVEALNLAQENAKNNRMEIEFFHFDILNQESLGFMRFDVMVSNPPYVRLSESSKMAPNVLDHEPHHALFVDDEHPLIFYRKIVDLADGHLNGNGKLYFEINEAFGNDIVQLLKDRGFIDVLLRKDLNGRNRMIRATKP